MTAYREYVVEYPQRVLRAWEENLERERAAGREVSFTLTAIAAAVGTPLELLGFVHDQHQPLKHPMGPKGHANFQPVYDALGAVLDAPFLGSVLGPKDGKQCSWHFGLNIPSSQLGHTDSWAASDTKVHAAQIKCGKVLRILRHASAHANVRVCEQSGETIKRVVLINFPPGGTTFSFVSASPEDIEALVMRWKTLVDKLEAMTPPMSDALKAAQAA